MLNKISKLRFNIPKNYFCTNRHYDDLLKIPHQEEFLYKQESNIERYIDKVRKFSHYYAKIDPLNLFSRQYYIKQHKSNKEFPSYEKFGLTQDQYQNINDSYLSEVSPDIKTFEKNLKSVYQDSISVEFDHIQNPEMKAWLYYNFEKYQMQQISKSEKTNIHTLLIQSETLDHYLNKKFATYKRYSGEGAESYLILLRNLFAKSSELGVTDIILNGAHRGRMNLLCNLLDFPPREIFRKIDGYNDLPSEVHTLVDDVASHLAVSINKLFLGTGCKEKPVTVSYLHNPSHLEGVNSVGQGKTRAKQDAYGNVKQVVNIALHGDAAISGQGIVYEGIQVSTVPNFDIGGCIHVIINNQIGYTTGIKDSRGSRYCSDLMKAFDFPIIHVNANDPEAVHKVAKFASDFRQTFLKDIMIDFQCFRKYGHNEVDEPEFTQPSMYKKIKSTVSIPLRYHNKLLQEGIVHKDQFQNLKEKVTQHLENEYSQMNKQDKTVKDFTNPLNKSSRAFTNNWKNCVFSLYGEDYDTGVDVSKLHNIAKVSITVPPQVTIHPRLQKFFIQDRLKQIENNNLDWATAEALSIGSLVEEGNVVRLSGEDVERGTFSQRHMVFIDYNNEKEYTPLKELEKVNKGSLHCMNSPLSEACVLSYEVGYSMDSPNNLNIWEAQFGDFFNTAQSTIDTFVVGSESKWARQSSIVMILPAGYDGAGPEHSTCRMERFLQMGSTDGINRYFKGKSTYQNINFQFAIPTTPANYFHLLRRQMKRNYRKPLVISGPKSMLRMSEVVSKFEDMAPGTAFKPIIQMIPLLKTTKKLFICAGKFCYDLFNMLKDEKDCSLIVLQELLPFPEELLAQVLSGADSQNSQVIYAQEEPCNSGGYSFVEPHVARILKELNFKNREIDYVGRRSIAVPAIGYTKGHKQEIEEIKKQIKQYIN